MTITLTVGQVSGIIATAIFVLQFLLPNALIVVLISLLGERHTLVTWSVVQQNILSSLWPTFLRTDSTASKGVNLRVRIFTWAKPLGLALVTLAAIVTPLGLYSAIEPDRNPSLVSMQYIPDIGPFGYGTAARSDLGFSRSCGDYSAFQCPGTTTLINYDVINQTGPYTIVNGTTVVNDDYDMRIPKVLAELYQSGLSTQQPSVSSFFDIQTRLYGITKTNEKAFHLCDSFKYLQSVILNNKVEAVEGLVVDTVTGGIGFRNHTIPITNGLGAEWYEDLLWIEPETVCVNNNITLEMTAPDGSTVEMTTVNITLVDNGGFANLAPHYPECDLGNTQEDAQLWCRAHKAAWMTNFYNMLLLNVTRPSPGAFSYLNSHVGARYPLTIDQTQGATLGQIYKTNLFSSLVSSGPPSNYSLINTPGANYSNPFNIDSSNYSDIGLICSGAGGQDFTNLTNIYVECGLVLGTSVRIDGSETLIIEPGAKYRRSIYSCASTNKASIKTVHFKYNSTDTSASVKGLSILDVNPKQYNDTKSMPIWGVETVDFTLLSLTQLWGLISEDQAKSINLSVIQQEHLYLPGYMGILSDWAYGFEYIPGNSGPAGVLGTLYAFDDTMLPDYSGYSNVAMNFRWRSLSENETTVPAMMGLIWTDLAANSMVGTRNWNSGSGMPPNLQKRDSSPSSSNQQLASVTVYRNAIRYHWPYAIPAVLALALVSLITITAVFMAFSDRAAPARIRYYIHHLSSGRLLGSLYYPEESDREAPTKEWIAVTGKKESDLQRQMFNHRPTAPADPPKVEISYSDSISSSFREEMRRSGIIANDGKGYIRVDTEETRT